MSDTIGDTILEILKSELSDITSNLIVSEKCKAIGKTPANIVSKDLKKLIPLIMGPVLIFGGKQKSARIKDKFEKLRW
jgi:hypothetical protein